jgi:alpha-galactosidase
MKRPKITIVGGGSVTWVPRIVKDMLLTPSLCGAEFVLLDTKPAAARLTAKFIERLKKEFGVSATITATSDQESALRKADYVLITISTGGLAAMEHDIAIPEEYGIRHTVGDTSGPGGWARSIRNFGVFVELGEAINRLCPNALVLNYTNPMTVLTAVLAEVCEAPVVGLCHGLFENLEFLVNYYKLKGEHELSVQYAGLNHFFWITGIQARGRDLLADLRGRIARKSFNDLGQEYVTDSIGFWSACHLATDLFRAYGVMPYLGDRHTCEFMPPYIVDKRLMKEFKLARTPVSYRWTKFNQSVAQLKEMTVAAEIPKAYKSRSRETASEIISAHLEGRSFIDVGNVPNVGQVPDLPLGTVVETAVMVDGNGFTPLTHGPLPEPIVALLEPVAHAYNMTVRACFEQDLGLALQALRADPVCSHLSNGQVREMGLRLLRAHRKWIDMPA